MRHAAELLILLLGPLLGCVVWWALTTTTPPVPYDCADEIHASTSAMERRCEQALGRQLSELRSCQVRCPEPEMEVP